MSVRLEFAAHDFVGGPRIFAGAIDEVQQHAAAFGVAEEAVAQSRPFVRAFDQAGQIGHHEFAPVHFDDTELRMQRRERIVGDLRLRRADGCKEGRLAGIGKTDQAGIGDQLQPQADRAFLAGLAGIGVARRAIG